MRKIADADELERELRRLLAYVQSDRPSRSRIASELDHLSKRLAGWMPATSYDSKNIWLDSMDELQAKVGEIVGMLDQASRRKSIFLTPGAVRQLAKAHRSAQQLDEDIADWFTHMGA